MSNLAATLACLTSCLAMILASGVGVSAEATLDMAITTRLDSSSRCSATMGTGHESLADQAGFLALHKGEQVVQCPLVHVHMAEDVTLDLRVGQPSDDSVRDDRLKDSYGFHRFILIV